MPRFSRSLEVISTVRKYRSPLSLSNLSTGYHPLRRTSVLGNTLQDRDMQPDSRHRKHGRQRGLRSQNTFLYPGRPAPVGNSIASFCFKFTVTNRPHSASTFPPAACRSLAKLPQVPDQSTSIRIMLLKSSLGLIFLPPSKLFWRSLPTLRCMFCARDFLCSILWRQGSAPLFLNWFSAWRGANRSFGPLSWRSHGKPICTKRPLSALRPFVFWGDIVGSFGISRPSTGRWNGW